MASELNRKIRPWSRNGFENIRPLVFANSDLSTRVCETSITLFVAFCIISSTFLKDFSGKTLKRGLFINLIEAHFGTAHRGGWI